MNGIQDEIKRNPVLSDVQNVLVEQTRKGIEKYGATVSYENLNAGEWIEHAKEETADKLVYLTCLGKSIQLIEKELNELHEIFERERQRGEHTAYKSKFDEGYAHAMKLAKNLLKETIQKLEGERNG